MSLFIRKKFIFALANNAPMRTTITFFLSILACCYSRADSFTLNSRQVTTADGLAGNTINALVQDDEGFIWIATNNGLSRYDGFTTANYTSMASDSGHRLEARVGRIFSDRRQGLLWLNTATYQNACYNLKEGRFVDWTGRGDQYRRQSKLMLTTRGMVLYGNNSGATLSGMTDGRPWAKDFRQALGNMASDDVLTVVEDSSHNIWLPTADGISVLRAGHRDTRPERLLAGTIIAAATTGRATYFLSSDGTVAVYDTQLRQVQLKGNGTIRMPAVMKRPSKVNVGFIWQGRWMLFTPEGTYAMNLHDGTFEKPAAWQVDNGLDQGTCPGYHFVANSSGHLWLFADSGSVKTLDLIPNARYSTNRGRKFNITRTADGRLFIATYGNGLFVYSPVSGQLQHYGANDANPLIHSDYLQCAMTDRQGNVWIGSEAAGAYCLSAISSAKAHYVKPKEERLSDWDNAVSAMMPTEKGLLFGTRQGHIYLTDKSRPLSVVDQKHAPITAHLRDSHGHTWTGTWGDGLYIDGRHYTTTDSLHHLPTDVITHIAEDPTGRVWVATWKAGLLLMDHEGQYKQMLHEDYNGSRINDLEPTDDGTVWVASNNGIYRIKDTGTELYNTENRRFPHNEIHTICSDGKGSLWVGTAGGGVVKCQLDNDGNIVPATVITTGEGLANNNVASIVIDRRGYVWVGTEDGVSRINPETNSVSSYRFASTPQGNTCNNNCATTDSKGRLLIGTADGLLLISPDALLADARPLHSRITDLYINGTSVLELGLLHQALSRTERLELAHNQNSLRLYFSDFEYDSHRRPAFQYFLEGLESGWQSTTTGNHADYSELHPGHYTFHLRSMNAEGKWNDEETLQIIIRQPWWNTLWAWLAYVLLLAGITYYVYRNARERFRIHQQMKMERQLSEFRSQLFTNITHEFRTPLAIIKGAIDKLSTNSNDRAALQTAQRGTGRLLRLVNLFMEFRKATTGNLRLQVEQADIVGFVRNMVQDFWTMTQQKDIAITFTPSEKKHLLPFDKQMVETIVYNLLSNAVKYTPEHGSIRVGLHIEAAELLLTVEDNGPGISAEQQARLFKPFMNGYASQGGMGIGLYTARQMAAAHKGQLEYEPADHGSRFTLRLPATDAPYSVEDYRTPQGLAGQEPEQPDSMGEALIREMRGEAFNEQTVAIVEDNPDMMEQISTVVGEYFQTATYGTGQAFLKALETTTPDLLICDVMLPDTDGYAIVTQMKSKADTAAIPVIMLTALDDEAHQIRAYRAGADDYMVKPCNFRLLIARAMQLIKWSSTKKVADAATAETANNVSPIIESRADKLFLDKLAILTAQHIGESTFSVDLLAQMMNIGRTKFYGKVKEMTGMSPNKYLQEARLQKAADLLADGELTVAEVSYKVGFQDPSYFNKCFKAKYGVVPSKYVRGVT